MHHYESHAVVAARAIHLQKIDTRLQVHCGDDARIHAVPLRLLLSVDNSTLCIIDSKVRSVVVACRNDHPHLPSTWVRVAPERIWRCLLGEYGCFIDAGTRGPFKIDVVIIRERDGMCPDKEYFVRLHKKMGLRIIRDVKGDLLFVLPIDGVV